MNYDIEWQWAAIVMIKHWNALHTAMEPVSSGELKAYAAAKQYGIPSNTLIVWPHKREINKKVWLGTNCPHSRRKEGDNYRCCKPRSSVEFLCPRLHCYQLQNIHQHHTSPPPQQLNSSILPVCNAFQCLINHNYSSSLPFNIIVHVSFLLTT